MMPKPTFSPCMNFLHSGNDGRALAIMWAVARPPLSKPRPESSTLASTHLLDGRRDHVQLDRPLGLDAVFHERVEAEPGQGHGGHGRDAAGQVRPPGS